MNHNVRYKIIKIINRYKNTGYTESGIIEDNLKAYWGNDPNFFECSNKQIETFVLHMPKKDFNDMIFNSEGESKKKSITSWEVVFSNNNCPFILLQFTHYQGFNTLLCSYANNHHQCKKDICPLLRGKKNEK